MLRAYFATPTFRKYSHLNSGVFTISSVTEDFLRMHTLSIIRHTRAMHPRAADDSAFEYNFYE